MIQRGQEHILEQGNGTMKARRPGVQLVLSKYSVLIAGVIAIGGCGGDQPVTYPVAGTVKLRDGTPAKSVTVKFRTMDRTPPVTSSGKTDDLGKFQFNAAEGENAAMVVPTFPRDTDNMSPAERDRVMNPIDPIFLDYESSQLKFLVTTDSAKNQFEIKVWPPRR